MKRKKEVRVDPALLPAPEKTYDDGVADGRLEMQTEMDEQLLAGLAAVIENGQEQTPVLISVATANAVMRFWRKHTTRPFAMEWRVVTRPGGRPCP